MLDGLADGHTVITHPSDKIIDGVTGCLVEPRDLTAFGAAVCGLMLDHEAAL